MVDCVKARMVCGKVETPNEDAILTPWVEIIVGNKDAVIRSGNRSCPTCEPTHAAVIKSFQIGSSNGAGCTIEVADEAGGEFSKFFDRLTHDAEGLQRNDYIIKVHWGWKGVNCNNSGQCTNVNPGDTRRCSSKTHHLVLNHIKVAYKAGGMIFTIVGTDIMQYTFEVRNEQVFGSTTNPLTLKQAIINLFKSVNPAIVVKFLRATKGQPVEYEFRAKVGGSESVRGVWHASSGDPIQVAMRWISNFTTDNGLGVTPAYDTNPARPTIIFWEGRQVPRDTGNRRLCENRNFLGTFIVNCGHAKDKTMISPVISFEPEIRWTFQQAFSAGGQVGVHGDATRRAEEARNQEELGLRLGAATTALGLAIMPFQSPTAVLLGNTVAEVTRNFQRNLEANWWVTNISTEPITATLRIQGRPDFDVWSDVMFGVISLIVINPFHIDAGRRNSNGCPQWLANPVCNKTLSNSNWQVTAFSHEIREGSYTTTFTIKLMTPGVDVHVDRNVGLDPDAARWGQGG